MVQVEEEYRKVRGDSPVPSLLDAPPFTATEKECSHRKMIPETTSDPPLSSYGDDAFSESRIERPRFTLHKGDFSEHSNDFSSSWSFPGISYGNQEQNYDDSRMFFASNWSPLWRTEPRGSVPRELDQGSRKPSRTRAPSLTSYSGTHALQAPTTPLIQQSSISDLECGCSSPRGRGSPEKSKRRYTLPPHALQVGSTSDAIKQPSLEDNQAQSTHEPGTSVHYSCGHRGHRPSLSAWSPTASNMLPLPGYSKRRRQSFGHESFPMQRSSLVGSYEESILHGWMSAPPSKPLDFTAKIGALGKGTCKPKFPPHTVIPFPAVFYDWSDDAHQGTELGGDPSPYVGTIDLQSHRSKAATSRDMSRGTVVDKTPGMKSVKRKRKSIDSRAFELLPGSYRIPEQGQLQIVIQNPNKTAVKVFIISYDLTGMKPGMKTFIRQRSYSVADGDLLGKAQHGEFAQKTKQKLRYMVHLNICCPTQGEFFLYHQVRVVFANRVPETEEQLQCETLVPSPMFSPYHPPRRSTPTSTVSTPSLRPATSSSFLDGPPTSPFHKGRYGALPVRIGTPPPPVPPIPFSLASSHGELREQNHKSLDPASTENRPIIAPSHHLQSEALTNSHIKELCRDTKGSIKHSPGTESTFLSSVSDNTGAEHLNFSRLAKADGPYGSPYARPSTPKPGQGLLAKRLREGNMTDMYINEHDQISDTQN